MPWLFLFLEANDLSMHLIVLLFHHAKWEPVQFLQITTRPPPRWGDPLSPFLFILITEGLSRLISRAKLENRIHGIRIVRGAPPISHLLFPDDLMVFGRANSFEAGSKHKCLHTYASWSGQTINLHKSFLHFSSNLSHKAKTRIRTALRLHNNSSKDNYLGLPIWIPRAKTQAFADVKNKITQKISG